MLRASTKRNTDNNSKLLHVAIILSTASELQVIGSNWRWTGLSLKSRLEKWLKHHPLTNLNVTFWIKISTVLGAPKCNFSISKQHIPSCCCSYSHTAQKSTHRWSKIMVYWFEKAENIQSDRLGHVPVWCYQQHKNWISKEILQERTIILICSLFIQKVHSTGMKLV